jgi:hypothetical protein
MAHNNPILDACLYKVEFQDGHKASTAAHTIGKNLFAQVNDKGNWHVLFEEITDHRTNEAQVMQQDAFIVNQSGTKRRKDITIGWEQLVKWKDSTTTWVSLKDLKESYPVQLAEYAVPLCLAEEPVFAWWRVPFTLQKSNRNIAKVKSKYLALSLAQRPA